MSHVTRISGLEIKSKEALIEAVNVLNSGEIAGLQVDCKLLKNATARSYNDYRNCDFVLDLGEDSWQVAFNYDETSKCYIIQFDTWNGTIQKKLSFEDNSKNGGKMRGAKVDIAKFIQAYSYSAIKEHLQEEDGIDNFEANLDENNELQMLLEVA